MKNKNLLLIGLVLVFAIFATSCKKDASNTNQDTPKSVSSVSGLGSNPGLPAGTNFELPKNIKIIGSIRGGLPFGKVADKSFKGPFPFNNNPKNWITYGTGTFVNLYIMFYNTLPTPATLTLPGGLIFCDSLDAHSLGTYQKGFILQDVTIPIPAMDTAFACISAYCLNHTLLPSSYSAVYYLGPITTNQDLNQIVSIMAPKQYPYGAEYDIQSIVWNVTDYGLTLTATEISYLNSLP